MDSGAEILPPEVLEGDDLAWEAAYRELASDTHPEIKKAQELLAAQMTMSSFTTALDFLLVGFGEPRRDPTKAGSR